MNIYVSNLNYKMSNVDLEGLFANYGQVSSAKIIMDRETGRSRGFGFVEMENDEEAAKAIEGLNQTEVEGKVISVAEARPREDKPKRSFGDGSFRSDRRAGGFRPRRDD